MITSRPFAMICKNISIEKFKEMCDKEIDSYGLFDFYAFIEHTPESYEDEKHIHIYIQPKEEMNTSYFTRGIAKNIKFADWYLLASHNKAYLSNIGQEILNIKQYSKKDFFISDETFFEEELRTNEKILKFQKLQKKYFDTF